MIGVARPEEFIAFSNRGDRPVEGVEIAGDIVLRNSVYAVGGVNGVFDRPSSSCLMTTKRSPGIGLLGICEGNLADSGNVAELGVMRAGRVGFVVDVGVLMVGGSWGFTSSSVAVGMVTVDERELVQLQDRLEFEVEGEVEVEVEVEDEEDEEEDEGEEEDEDEDGEDSEGQMNDSRRVRTT